MSNLIGEEYQANLTTAKPPTMDDQQGLNDASRVAVEQVQADWEKIRSAQKEQFIDSHKTKLEDTDLTIFNVPRKGCHYCHGTGVEGAYTNDSTKLPSQPRLCRCLTNKLVYHPGSVDTNRLTYGAFKQLMATARQRYNLKESTNETTKVDTISSQRDDEEFNTRRDAEQSGQNNSASIR